jgi:hypothetical protein
VLTEKQETFCRNIVSGMTNKDAYISAYSSSGSEQNAWNESGKLMAREDIQERIKTLRKPLEIAALTKALSERERVKAILWDRLQKAIDRDDDAAIVRYTDQINRMNSEYTQVHVNLEDKAADIKALDTSVLEKLARPS